MVKIFQDEQKCYDILFAPLKALKLPNTEKRAFIHSPFQQVPGMEGVVGYRRRSVQKRPFPQHGACHDLDSELHGKSLKCSKFTL
jgi:hypothetical protein